MREFLQELEEAAAWYRRSESIYGKAIDPAKSNWEALTSPDRLFPLITTLKEML